MFKCVDEFMFERASPREASRSLMSRIGTVECTTSQHIVLNEILIGCLILEFHV